MNANQNPDNSINSLGDNQLTDLISLKEIQRLQDLFANANGVASVITFPDGTPITRPSRITCFCKDLIQGTDHDYLKCFQSDENSRVNYQEDPITPSGLNGGLWLAIA